MDAQAARRSAALIGIGSGAIGAALLVKPGAASAAVAAALTAVTAGDSRVGLTLLRSQH